MAEHEPDRRVDLSKQSILTGLTTSRTQKRGQWHTSQTALYQHAYIKNDLHNGQNDHHTIKDVEAVCHVLKEAQSKQLEDHLHGEKAREDVIADGQRLSKGIGHACGRRQHPGPPWRYVTT